MDEEKPRKSAPNARGRPFPPGNSGKPPGTRHKVTRAVEELLDGEAEKLTRKCIEKALGGDMMAIRLCLDRIAPPRKDRPISIDMPPMARAADAVVAVDAIVGAVGQGELSAAEAGDLAKLIETYVKTLTATEIEIRLKALEEKGSK